VRGHETHDDGNPGTLHVLDEFLVGRDELALESLSKRQELRIVGALNAAKLTLKLEYRIPHGNVILPGRTADRLTDVFAVLETCSIRSDQVLVDDASGLGKETCNSAPWNVARLRNAFEAIANP
jgi:hypothetical protein